MSTPRRFTLPLLLALAVPLLLSACGGKADRAYRACTAQVEEGLAEMQRESGAAGAIAKPMLDMARAAGNAGCEAIRDACKREPDGIVCRSAMEELKAN